MSALAEVRDRAALVDALRLRREIDELTLRGRLLRGERVPQGPQAIACLIELADEIGQGDPRVRELNVPGQSLGDLAEADRRDAQRSQKLSHLLLEKVKARFQQARVVLVRGHRRTLTDERAEVKR